MSQKVHYDFMASLIFDRTASFIKSRKNKLSFNSKNFNINFHTEEMPILLDIFLKTILTI